jgi:hypothetical protein
MKKLFILLIAYLSSFITYSQSISLDPNSLQLPRLATNPACTVNDKGKMIFNTTQNKVLFCDGTAWIDPSTGGTPNNWVNSGNNSYLQSSSGKVGIGLNNPSAKLDILHGGGVGILNKSSLSFATIDIDAFSGDAALRFAKAGVSQWNIRNQPINNDLQIIEMGGNGIERFRIENTTGKVVISGAAQVVGTLSKGGGSFKIDHPLDPENKYLYHSFVESPDMMNIYNGNVTTDASGKATIELPDYFQALNMEYRYQLTPIGTFAQAIISKKVDKNRFEITTDKPSVEVSWQVTGIRNDAFAQKNRIPTVELKSKEEIGKYLHPTAFGKPESKSIGFDLKRTRTGYEPSSIDDNSIEPNETPLKKVVEGIQSTDVKN